MQVYMNGGNYQGIVRNNEKENRPSITRVAYWSDYKVGS